MMMAIPGSKPNPEPDEDTAPEAVKLRQVFGDAPYRAWLREMVIGEMDADGEITVTVPGAFRRDYIKQHFADRLFQLLREDQPQLRRIVIEAGPTERRQADG
jgi:chromosomal replication initiator protein